MSLHSQLPTALTVCMNSIYPMQLSHGKLVSLVQYFTSTAVPEAVLTHAGPAAAPSPAFGSAAAQQYQLAPEQLQPTASYAGASVKWQALQWRSPTLHGHVLQGAAALTSAASTAYLRIIWKLSWASARLTWPVHSCGGECGHAQGTALAYIAGQWNPIGNPATATTGRTGTEYHASRYGASAAGLAPALLGVLSPQLRHGAAE